MDLLPLMRFVVAAVLVLAGCGDAAPTPERSGAGSGEATWGTEGGGCYPNGTCNTGLACTDGICMIPTEGDEGGPCYPNDTCNEGFSCTDGRCHGATEDAGDTGTSDTGESDGGLRATLLATPNPVYFGRVSAPDCAGAVATLQAVNGAQTITALTLSDTSVFSVVPAADESLPTPANPWILAANEVRRFTVVFCPDDSGSDLGSIAVTTLPNLESALVIELKGNISPPCLAVLPATGDFGYVRMDGQAGRLPLTLTNCSRPDGGENLEISAFSVSTDSFGSVGPIFGLDPLPATPLTLAPGASAQVFATCVPAVERRRETGRLVIASNDPAFPELELPLACVGTTNECPSITGVACVQRGVIDAVPSSDLTVPPLANLDCVADCIDPDGSCVNYTWRIISRPAESSSEFTPASSASSGFFVDANGEYEVQVDAQDDRGLSASSAACNSSATLRVRAVPDAAFYTQVTWNTPADPNPRDEGAGTGSDIDLHVLNPEGCWEDRQWDCHFRTRTADWGVVGFTGDDCSLDRDDTDGWGPEIVSIDDPAAGVYKVGVHYWSDKGYGVSYATVIITVDGIVAYEARDKALPSTGTWWELCAVSWPSRNLVPIDRITSTVPVCL